MRAVAWLVSVGALLAPSMLPASGETLYCTDWQGIRTCSSPDGRVSHLQWQGMSFDRIGTATAGRHFAGTTLAHHG
jgi:hypothetical protein